MGLGNKVLPGLGRLVVQQREFASAERDPERIYRGHRLRGRFAGMQTTHDVEPVRTVVAEKAPLRLDYRLHGDGDIKIGTAPPDHTVEAGRGDAHNAEGKAVDEHGLADDGRLREMAVPVVKGKNRDGIGFFCGLVTGQKQAAGGRLYPKGLKIIAADQLERQLFGMVVPGDAGIRKRGGGEPAEDLVVVAQVAVHRIRKIMVVTRAVSTLGLLMPLSATRVAEDNKLAWILHREGA